MQFISLLCKVSFITLACILHLLQYIWVHCNLNVYVCMAAECMSVLVIAFMHKGN